MKDLSFGILKKYSMKEVFKQEAQVFTPWLAENISELGQLLGVELDVKQMEAPVGPYSADILAEDLTSSTNVIIENQFDKSDHAHLGKMLTYAAGYDVSKVIWVADIFTDEHLSTIKWLNDRTDANTSFFAVTVEVSQIDNSPKAFQFRIIAQPDNWLRKSKESALSVSPKEEKYTNFFRDLIQELKDKKIKVPNNTKYGNWCRFSSGFSNAPYYVSFTYSRQVRVELAIFREDFNLPNPVYDELGTDKDNITIETGYELTWEPQIDTKQSRIAYYFDGTIEDSPEELKLIKDNIIAALLKFQEVFNPRLKKIISKNAK